MINISRFKLKKDRTPRKGCFCRHPELIENYDKAIADTTQVWQCHHRLETHNSDGERRLVDISSAELIALDMYFDRSPEELIFLTSAEHVSLHNNGKLAWTKGKHHTEEVRRKISEAHKGKHLSEEHKRKISEAHKGKHVSVSEETKKKMKQSMKGQHKGKHWFNNGEICTRCFDCPEGFVPGILRK